MTNSTISTNLIEINQTKVDGELIQTVNARDLHEFLEVTSRFNDWILNRIKDFGFEEGSDYSTFTENLVKGRPAKQYAISIDMAKELSMVERNDKGKEARQYFIQCEKQVKQLQLTKQHNLTNYDISIIGNVVKNCTALVVQQQLETLLPDMVEARLAKHNFLLREGKTAKQIWDSCNLPPKIKGSTTWFGNRLKEMSCSIENEGRADAGSGRTIRLFDPDKANLCLKNGLLHKSKVYASERMGQSKLRLVGQA